MTRKPPSKSPDDRQSPAADRAPSGDSTAAGLPTLPMSSLYVHVPFCVKRCDYCAFYTLAGVPTPVRAAYLERLAAEMAAGAPACAALDHVYIGGGTPTHLTPPELEHLFAALRRHFRFAADCEFTVEANPLTLTAAKLDQLFAAGVTRLSLGVQSFNQRVRTAIGRDGTAEKAFDAVQMLRNYGFTNYNVDLIYGAPEQTMVELEADLAMFRLLTPAHVSTYSLMVEPGTPLAERGAQEADDGLLAAMWETIARILGTDGLQRYEVSNFSQPGRECRHNQHVWHGGRFLGIGPSACWFDGTRRLQNPPDLDAWMAGATPVEDVLPAERRAAEILIYGLRTTRGWTVPEFRAVTGYDLTTFRAAGIAALAAEGLLEWRDHQLRMPAAKLIFADYVGRELLD